MEDLTSEQRARLRDLTNSIDTILHVDKGGIKGNLVKQADDALEARELIEGRVLGSNLLNSREVAEILISTTRSQVVQVIGTKFVLYHPTHRRDKKDRVVLITSKKHK